MSTWQPSNITDLSGRVFLITGGTAGLGENAIRILAQHNPGHIYFTGRNAKKGNDLIQSVRRASPNAPISFIQCDLTDLHSVAAMAEDFTTKSDRLDVLMCNAGIMAVPPSVTKDGYEIQFGTNHVGHALLTKKLLPVLQRTAAQPGADVRIINLSSVAYKQAPAEGFQWKTLKSDQSSIGSVVKPGKWLRYGQSKLANLLYAQQLAKRYPNITSVSVHPGFVKTDLTQTGSLSNRLTTKVMAPFNGGWLEAEQGSWTQVWAATTPKQNLANGAFYVPVAKPGQLETAQSRDSALGDKLWDWTQKELATY